jgi:DNA-binding NarL/FixJ family response regulator
MLRPFDRPQHRDERRAAIRLLIVDDHLAVRQGLQQMFAIVPGIEVVGVAADGRQAISKADQLRPDVVLMDLEMPHVDGVEATRRITTTHPTSRVVILTASHNRRRVQDALQAGATNCLPKDSDPDEVVRAVQEARAAGT